MAPVRSVRSHPSGIAHRLYPGSIVPNSGTDIADPRAGGQTHPPHVLRHRRPTHPRRPIPLVAPVWTLDSAGTAPNARANTQNLPGDDQQVKPETDALNCLHLLLHRKPDPAATVGEGKKALQATPGISFRHYGRYAIPVRKNKPAQVGIIRPVRGRDSGCTPCCVPEGSTDIPIVHQRSVWPNT